MKLIRGVWGIVGQATRLRMLVSASCSVGLALLDTLAVLLLFPLIQMLVTDHSDAPVSLGLGATISSTDVTVLAIVVAGLFVTKSLSAIVFLRWNLGFILDADTETATRVFANHLARSPGQAAPDVPALQRTLTESIRRVFQDGLAFALPAIADDLVIILLGAAMLAIAPLEGIVAATVFGLAAFAYRTGIHARTRRAGAVLHGDQRRAIAISSEALRASREIALTGSDGHFIKDFETLRRRVSGQLRTIALNEQLPRSFLEICLLVCTASVAAVAFTQRSSADAIAVVGTLAAIGFRVLPSLNRALLAAGRARTAQASLEQIEADLATVPRAISIEERNHGPVVRIVVHNASITFAEREEPLLRDVSFELHSGEMVCVVGASGAGKSTLVNAMLGFVPITSGSVLINEIEPVLGPDSWNGRAAYVPQDVVLFDTSLRENVAFGVDPSMIDDARVAAALRQAHLDDIVEQLPSGWATSLGEGGALLSGGQKQRLGIARALYHHADVLVLDESTAGLDSATEQRVLDTLDELKDERIILIISHHDAILRRCNRRIVVGDGRVLVERAQLRDLVADAGARR